MPDPDHRPRHRHKDAYATVVLSGAFEQAGYFGRHRLGEGDILIQPTLDCHADQMLSAGLTIIRLPWRFDPSRGGVYRGCDVDTIQKLAARDVAAASKLLETEISTRRRQAPLAERAADGLAAGLTKDPALKIGSWASAQGVSREGLSRSFRHGYGVSAARYRLELRARGAWQDILASDEPFAALAASRGYSDQPHMIRSVRRLTGSTPEIWRAWSQRCKTETGS